MAKQTHKFGHLLGAPKRPLLQEDKTIWQKVARTVRPLAPHSSAPNPKNTPQNTQSHMHFPPTPGPILHRGDGDIQIRRGNKIRKGKIAIDSKIDLHDFTRDQAFPVLVRKITHAYASRARTVLVVTGKGPNLEGVLRQSLPSWLGHTHIRPLIAGYAQAHIRHGGAGAFYVFLKANIG